MGQVIVYRTRRPQVSSGLPPIGAVHVPPLTLPDISPELDEWIAAEQSWPRPAVVRGNLLTAAVWAPRPWVTALRDTPPDWADVPLGVVRRGNFLTQAIWAPQPMVPALRDIPLDALLDAPPDRVTRGAFLTQAIWGPQPLLPALRDTPLDAVLEAPRDIVTRGALLVYAIARPQPVVVVAEAPNLETAPQSLRPVFTHVAVTIPPTAVIVAPVVEPNLEPPAPQAGRGLIPAARHLWAPAALVVAADTPTPPDAVWIAGVRPPAAPAWAPPVSVVAAPGVPVDNPAPLLFGVTVPTMRHVWAPAPVVTTDWALPTDAATWLARTITVQAPPPAFHPTLILPGTWSHTGTLGASWSHTSPQGATWSPTDPQPGTWTP